MSSNQILTSLSGADPGGGRWGGRPPLGWSFTFQNALFNDIQALVQRWAPTPGRNPVSATDYGSSYTGPSKDFLMLNIGPAV